MTEDLPAGDDRTRRLDRVVRSILDDLAAGREPDAARLLASHPDLAPELAEWLAGRTVAADGGTRPAGTETEILTGTGPEATAPLGDAPEATADAGPGSGPGTPAGGRDPAPGDRVRYVGDYELREELGRGGMGIVYRARQISLNRPVALKMMRSAALADEGELRRFRNEAESVALLDHPHIVPIHEVGTHEQSCYFSMKLIEGSGLDRRLAALAGDPRTAARLAATIAEAVHHAHQRGILHRDLKPANILVDPAGEPHVTDFGLARRVEGGPELTASGAVLGTPAYMAPEQAAGRRSAITVATDVYGLGATLYAMLAGRAPFGGDSVVETLEKVRNSDPEPPRRLNPKVPRDLEVIALKCLEKDPRRRYAGADELALDLRRWLAGEPIAARPVGAAARFGLWCRRNPVVAALSAAVVLVSLAGLAFGAAQWRSAVDSAALAVERAEVARRNERRAVEAAQALEERRAELARSNDALRHASYASTVQLAHREWDRGNVPLARRLLAGLAPEPGQADLRGFDWAYLHNTCDAALLVVPLPRPAATQRLVRRRLAFDPTGNRIAVTDGSAVRVLDAADGRTQVELPEGHGMAVAYSPDGRWLAMAGQPPGAPDWQVGAIELAVRDASTGELRRTFPISPAGFDTRLAFSPDGRWLAVATTEYRATSLNEVVLLFDAESWPAPRTLYSGEGSHEALDFSPDSARLAAGVGMRSIRIWSAADASVERTIDASAVAWVRSVAFSPDGRRLAAIGDGGTARVYGLEDDREIQVLRVAEQDGLMLAYSPDGLHLATLEREGNLRFWDAQTGEARFLIRGAGGDFAFSPDGQRVASFGDDSLRIWDALGPRQSTTLGPIDTPLYNLAVSPDGTRLVADGVVWDLNRLRMTYRIGGPGSDWRAAVFSPDGRRIACSSTRWIEAPGQGIEFGRLRVVDAETGATRVEATREAVALNDLVFSPDGRWLAASELRMDEAGASLYAGALYDAATLARVRTLEGFDAPNACLDFRPDGRELAFGRGNAIALVDPETGRPTRTIETPEGQPFSIRFRPDGGQFLALIRRPSNQPLLATWDAATGRRVLTVDEVAADLPNRAIFSPDGRRIVTGGFDTRVRVWDAATGKDLLALHGHTSWVWALASSPDGARLYSCGRDGTIRIWDGSPAGTDAGPAVSVPDLSRLLGHARTLDRRGRPEAALAFYERTLEACLARGLDDEAITATVRHALGDLLDRLGRPDQAEPLLLRSVEQAEVWPTLSRFELDAYRGRLIAFYESRGQPDRAAAWRAKRLDAGFPANPFAP